MVNFVISEAMLLNTVIGGIKIFLYRNTSENNYVNVCENVSICGWEAYVCVFWWFVYALAQGVVLLEGAALLE